MKLCLSSQMKHTFSKKILRILTLTGFTILLVAVGLFAAYHNPFSKNSTSSVTQPVEAQTSVRLEDGPPCDAPAVEGDINQGRRLHLNPPDIAPGDFYKLDVAAEFNKDCLKGAIAVPYGGFSDGTVEFDVEKLWNTMDTIMRGNITSDLGTEHSEFALYDNDITPTNSTPHAIQDFPSSCNVIFLRRQEGFRDNTIRDEDRLNYGSYCCQNGWGTSEYLTNPNDSKDISGETEPGENVTNNRSPEPDEDGDPRNGYTGYMTAHETIQWTNSQTLIDSPQQAIPSTTVSVAFKYRIPWPGLLFKHLTPAGGGDIAYYQSQARGGFIDNEKGNGVWDAAPGNCDGSQTVVFPFTPPSGESDWVIPVAHPCPAATPKTDENGQFAWGHDEPFQDSNHNGVYDCPDPNNEATCEKFSDTGNGYGGSGDTWTDSVPSLGGTVDPELIFNRQFLEIAGSPRVGTVARAVHMIFYPVTNIEIRGLYQQYTPSECPCRPADGRNPEEKPDFDPCQAVYQDTFNPELCGVCGANQPLLNGGETSYPANAYCEDTVPRTTNFRWPPFSLSTIGLKWEVSGHSITQLFDSVLKDAGVRTSVVLSAAPLSPQQGETVIFTAAPQSFSDQAENNYFAWTINDYSQQGLAAGATERIEKDHYLAPPDFIYTDPTTGIRTVNKETRTFFFAPTRPPQVDSDNDGLDDNWERRYFGSLDPKPNDDSDDDGRAASDYASSAKDLIPGDDSAQSYAKNGRYIQIVPGIWLVRGDKTKQFIAPQNFNPEWTKRPDNYKGFTNVEEYVWGTNPVDADTDDDGYTDGVDILGMHQYKMSYVNPHDLKDPERDKVGVITLGNVNAGDDRSKAPLAQLACSSKIIFTGNGESPQVYLLPNPALPTPGQPLTITALLASQDSRAGFLTYDWYVNGRQVVTSAPGQNTLQLTAQDTQSFQPGTYVDVRVVAINTNQAQKTFGQRIEQTKSILMGLNYESLLVYQPAGKLIYPTASNKDFDQGPVHINRSDDVTISLTNVWPDKAVTDNLYIEWQADGIVQTAKAAGRGSGKGGSFVNFTFTPRDFLPDGVTDSDVVNKVLPVIARVVDTRSQHEILRVSLKFVYNNPLLGIKQSVSADGKSVVLEADAQHLADASKLQYVWKVNGIPVDTGQNTGKITLPLLQASLGKTVELTVSNIGGKFTKELSARADVTLASLHLPWQKQFALSVWNFIHAIPQYARMFLLFTFILTVIFFGLYGLYRFILQRYDATS